MLSSKVKEELLEASSHLRAALRNSAANENPRVCKQIADVLMCIDTIEKTENLMDSLDSLKLGGGGPFFGLNP